jgi:hypothetical protein
MMINRFKAMSGTIMILVSSAPQFPKECASLTSHQGPHGTNEHDKSDLEAIPTSVAKPSRVISRVILNRSRQADLENRCMS